MILALLIGTLVGIILAMPPGPVGVTAIKLGLFQSKKSGYHLAAGNAVMDFIYSLVAIFATAAAIDGINSISSEYPLLVTFLQVAIIVTMVAFGIISLKSKPKEVDFSKNPDEAFKSSLLKNIKSRGPFFLGAAIALTNLANPSFIPALGWISVQMHNYALFENNASSNFMYALGFGLGNFIWIVSLVKLITKYKHRMSENMLLRIRQFAGVTFIGFGTVLGYRLLMVTKWSELLRFVFVV